MFGRLKAVRTRMWQLNAAAERPIYIGHKENRVYHRHDCKYGMKMRRGRRFLYTQKRAWAEGFRPCSVCQPDRHPYKEGERRPGFWDSLR
jgi:methylphosphotriester-DNA--protein-cysteine methyltransferase